MPSIITIATVVFWACAAAMVYVYLGYPLLLALMALFARRRQPDDSYTPTISVLIAAYNEAGSIGRE